MSNSTAGLSRTDSPQSSQQAAARSTAAARSIRRGLVLADDLTGACASAALLAERRLPCHVATAGRVRLPATGQIAVVDLGTRELDLESARARWHDLVAELIPCLQQPDCWISFRIDTTMRGNIGAMTSALLEATALQQIVVVVAPAYPAHGRTTRDGRVWIEEELLHDFLSRIHYRAPIHSSFIPDILRLTPGSYRLQSARQFQPTLDPRLHIVDASSQSDLDRVADTLCNLALLCIPLDPGPLTARVLDQSWALPRPRRDLPPPQSGTVLLAVGSRTLPTNRQIEVLQQHFQVGVLRPGQICSSPGVFFALPPGSEPVEIARCVASALNPRSAESVTLVLSGGETAAAVCQELGIERLDPLRQLEPLIGQCRVLNGRWAGLTVVTKGGLVGEVDVYCRILERLRQPADAMREP